MPKSFQALSISSSFSPTKAIRCAAVIFIAETLYLSATSASFLSWSDVTSPAGIWGAIAYVSLSRWSTAPFSSKSFINIPPYLIWYYYVKGVHILSEIYNFIEYNINYDYINI